MKIYSIKNFYEQFPDDNSCLDYLFKVRYDNLECCPYCKSKPSFSRVKNRKTYQCSKCSFQISPCKDTIYEKSRTPLTIWFYTIFLLSTSKDGLTAKQLQRVTGLTYKTCWRMLNQIRSTLYEENDKDVFSGVVELDETYIGGKNKNRHYFKKIPNTKGRSWIDKAPVLGIIQRSDGDSLSKVKTFHVPDTKAESLIPLVRSYVKEGTHIMTDEWQSYNAVRNDYTHGVVYHGKGNYVTGNVHTNGAESYWSIVKRVIKSHIQVSRKYLQSYLDECAFKFNNRGNPQLFTLLLKTSCLSV